MSMLTFEQVAEQALQLPLSARAKLARQLLQSLEPVAEAEIERLWLDEAERRDAEMESGQAGIPIQEVLDRAQASLK